ncbi:hypothetical protein MHUMG1_01933 [Metarhizium humberi]|uniref:Uncharacterized protein n=1 Tax=Metarhizium humberi TaxID=2596975 RepID=A0A9P8SBV4_9HYPO|nr:hypothetical protein MHUMG1_01933 [Metarhizium humberi]
MNRLPPSTTIATPSAPVAPSHPAAAAAKSPGRLHARAAAPQYSAFHPSCPLSGGAPPPRPAKHPAPCNPRPHLQQPANIGNISKSSSRQHFSRQPAPRESTLDATLIRRTPPLSSKEQGHTCTSAPA